MVVCGMVFGAVVSYHNMEDRCKLGNPDGIGSTTVRDHKCLAENIHPSKYMLCENSQGELDETILLDILHTDSNKGGFDLDNIMVSTVQKDSIMGLSQPIQPR